MMAGVEQKMEVEDWPSREEILGHISASSWFSNLNKAITLSCDAKCACPRWSELSLSKLKCSLVFKWIRESSTYAVLFGMK